ncbi:hypothetical protein NP493_1249g00018 [Ridgeia piscesae]|uniref:Uncharacterized protein n=1 Tax=Ridgeia piscesae TaxID=27915 RepID=A0AAD9NI45_RIDPI|nr:hypothetical protein NP493_1249g00018 [Ridgeia piscesae]
MLVGVLAAMLHGVSMPVAVYIFSEAVDVFVVDKIANEQLLLSDCRAAHNATLSPGTETLTSDINPLCVRLTYWAVIILVAGTVHTFCWNLTSERQVSRLRSHLFSAILHQDCAWFDSHDTGSLTVTLTNDIVNVASGMSDKVSLFIQSFTIFVASFIMALATNWRLSLAAFTLVPFITASILGAGAMSVKSAIRQGKAYAEAGRIAKEVLSAIRTVAAFGGESRDATRYTQYLSSARKVGIISRLLVGLSLGGMWFCHFAMTGLVNWYGTSLLVSDIGTTPGDVVFSVPYLEGIAIAGGSAQVIFEIIDTKPHIDSRSEDGLMPEQLLGHIAFERVDFIYESRPEIKVLDQVSLKTEVGKTIALVGPSGSGKSTICHLLLRLYDCTAGRVTVDGHDIKDINVKWLRQQIGVVSQEPVLFDGSISDNIRLGREGATQADIEEAAKMANAHNFIMMFPEKYNTLVGQRGAHMSGGQKQRIAIARALISNPRILLLDEATSALDSESEAIVQDALEKACKGRTTIVVAHRLSTVRKADVIHCLSQGRLIESGSHDELMAREGLYYNLVTSHTEVQTLNTLSTEIADVITDETSSPGITDAIEVKTKLTDETDRDEQKTEQTNKLVTSEAGKKSIFLRLVKLNAADWPYLMLGCVTVIISGSVPPMFAFVVGAVMQRIDGVDIRSLDVQWVRAQLALVSQEPVLFNTTIYDNIAYGDNTRKPTMDEVIDVAKKANIHNFIVSLPLGYDTNVGECGSQLSGGQKQRIAIARALLRNPRILLLDEATSALDTESEKLVQEALERAQEGRTCIVIAHRLSTIRSADKIVVMQDGVVVEEGTHDELMARESFYYDLVQKQVDALV